MIISFTGHRPNKIVGIEDNIFHAIKKLLIDKKPEICIVGMAQGVDIIAAKACIDLNIEFIAAVPFPNQWSSLGYNELVDYNNVITKASLIVEVCKSYEGVWVFQKRNEWMVDNSDITAAVWNGTKGGTANCVKYALKKNKTVIFWQGGENWNADIPTIGRF